LETPLSPWPKFAEYTGLSEYESKVYLALVDLGITGARKLSMACDVPRTKVYNTLKKLIDVGLVVEVPGKTKSFIAVAPDASLKSNLLVVRKRAEEFESIVKSLAETYKKKQLLVEPQKADVWVIQGREKILNRMMDLLSDSKKEVEILTGENGVVLFFKAGNKVLDKLKERGIKTTLSSPLDPNEQPLARELSYVCKVKKTDFELPILYLCVDHGRFILAKMIPNNLEMESDYDIGIFSEDASLLSMVYFLLKQGSSLSSYVSNRKEKIKDERASKDSCVSLLQRGG
jgi:sugar-specific transcriptional regulator TrmB